LTKIVDSGKLTSKRMEDIIEAIRVYWNFFIPAFPDGRAPAEVAGVKAKSWMQPLLVTGKERLDKLGVEIHPMDRHSEIVGQILSELERGSSTPRTVTINKIMEGLKKYGSAEQSSWRSLRGPRTAPKRGPSSQEPLELPTIRVPLASVFVVRNVKKARRKLREYSRKSHAEATGHDVVEDPRDGSFAVYQRTGRIGVRLGTISFLRDNRMFIGSLTSTRKNALQRLLTELMKGDLILLEELRDVKMPYR
jgi:hypothetical protein